MLTWVGCKLIIQIVEIKIETYTLTYKLSASLKYLIFMVDTSSKQENWYSMKTFVKLNSACKTLLKNVDL